MLMKVRKYSLLGMAMVQAIATLIVPMLPAFQQPAYAAAPFQSVFYYPSNNDTPNAVKDLHDSFQNMLEGSGDPKSIMGSTYVDIKGGPFGDSPQELDYNSSGTSPSNYMDYQLNNGHGYDCYVDGSGNAQLSIPDNAVYWHIDYDMYIHQDVGSDPPTFTSRERIASATKIQGPNPALQAAGGDGSAHPIDPPGTVKDNNAQGLGHPQINSLGMPSQCLPDPNYFSHHLSFSPIPSYYQDVADWPNITANPAGNAGGSGGVSEDACDANSVSLGWLLCPIINLAKTAIDGIITSVIIPELQVEPLDASSGSGANEYAIWNNIRTLADVLFVLIFLVMIFANTLQFNLNAYTIKKVIPKLVAAAILVQFSFIISAVIIDLGNILGQGIASLVGNVTIGTVNNNHQGGVGSILNTLGAPIDILAGLGLAAVIGIPTILVALITALIGAIGVLFTLIARRLIIVILVILAPLAFAAWVLPGTEKYFSMWLKMFIRITLMYPMIIFLLSAAAVAGSAVKNGSEIENLLAAILPIIAFFMIPMTFKWAGGAMSLAAGGFNKATGKVTSSGAMKGLRTSAREHQQRVNENRASGLASATVFGRNVPGSRRVLTGLGRVGTGQLLPTSRTQSDIALATQKAMSEESKRMDSLNLDRNVLRALAIGKPQDLKGNPLTGTDLEAYKAHSSVSKTLTGQAAVANQMAKKGDVEGLNAFRSHINTQVAQHGLDPVQATQLWNGAKAGAFSEIKNNDPIMAFSGWADSDYTGSSLQGKMGRLKGEDIAGMLPERLQEYTKNGATISVAQLASATTDKMREGKGAAHQDALLGLTHNGAAASDMNIQREHLIRFHYSSGAAVARSDTQVQRIKREMAKGGQYATDVDKFVADVMRGRPPATTQFPIK